MNFQQNLLDILKETFPQVYVRGFSKLIFLKETEETKKAFHSLYKGFFENLLYGTNTDWNIILNLESRDEQIEALMNTDPIYFRTSFRWPFFCSLLNQKKVKFGLFPYKSHPHFFESLLYISDFNLIKTNLNQVAADLTSFMREEAQGSIFIFSFEEEDLMRNLHREIQNFHKELCHVI